MSTFMWPSIKILCETVLFYTDVPVSLPSAFCLPVGSVSDMHQLWFGAKMKQVNQLPSTRFEMVSKMEDVVNEHPK